MTQSLTSRISEITAHRAIRDKLSGMVINNKALLPELMAFAFDTTNKNHFKACWICELVFEKHIEWLQEYLNGFCNSLSKFSHESALRPISKICLFAVEKHSKDKGGFLEREHINQITESCFDWLINPEGKVATKAYAMRALYLLGKKDDWIYPELENILSLDFPQHSAGYQAAAKDILRKIRKYKQQADDRNS